MKCSEQIYVLRDAIKSGESKPSTMAGMEFTFSRQWQMSRNDLWLGIERLVEEGLPQSRSGKQVYIRASYTNTRMTSGN